MSPRKNEVLGRVLADLAAEGDRLERLVGDLDEATWRTPTPAAGWDVATQIGHLAWTDEVALAAVAAAAGDGEAWDAVVLSAMEDPERVVDAAAEELGRMHPADLLHRWSAARAALADALRDCPDRQKMPWFGPPMSATSMATARFMETWAHGLDVVEALGRTYSPDDRIVNVAELGVRTRNFAFGAHGLTPPAEEFGITLVSPGEDLWTWGPEDARQTVTGSAYHFCLLVTQRRHRRDLDLVASGPDAERWLDIAQAFAGPPGEGRAPGGVVW